MDLIVLGLNHRTAPVEWRERLDFSKHPRERYLPKLASLRSVESALVLSTCNRVEIYAAGNKPDELIEDARGFLAEFHHVSGEELSKFLYGKVNRDAVRHLFRVAASLDSMVVGEPQILGQVKEAYFDAAAFSLMNPFFDRLLRKTFSVAKRVRSETRIAEQAVSISFAAVELAGKIFEDLKARQVLVLGGGEMAELAAQHFHQQRVKRLLFANRSYDASVEMARRFDGVPIPFDQFRQYLPEADVVLVSTAAPHYLVRPEELESAIEARRHSPIFVIDISVPRNVDPEVADVEDVYLYNIDDLEEIVRTNLKSRESEAVKAEAIVDMEVERFFELAAKGRADPLIRELLGKYEDVRRKEIQRLFRKLAALPDGEKQEIERAMDTLVRRVLNEPILFLKEEGDPETSDRIGTIRKIFAIDRSDPEEE